MPRDTRIAICGGPRTGKTTIASAIAIAFRVDPRPTDDLKDLDWSAASEKVASEWMAQPGPWVIEGVAVARALRKWMKANPTGKPCDRVVLMTVAHVELTKGQATMSKGCDTVWREIEPLLVERGVSIVRDRADDPEEAASATSDVRIVAAKEAS